MLAGCAIAPGHAIAQTGKAAPDMAGVLREAGALEHLHSLLIAHEGVTLAEQAFRGPDLDVPVNIKSVSKSIISTLAGIAIDRGLIADVDQPVLPALGDLAPSDLDPKIAEITLDDLLSMRAGLERTSGRNYGRWVVSDDWIAHALTRPFVDEPGGRMLYSTANSHLISAMLTRLSGSSTLSLARSWLGEPLGIEIPPWTQDPKGIYMGGNNMELSPRALLRFGEMYRQLGVFQGRRVLSRAWIETSWTPRTRSPFTGHHYGYGWYIANARGHDVHYAWGYGGQLVYVVPAFNLTVVTTSDPDGPNRRRFHTRRVHMLLANSIIPALQA